MTMLLTEKTKQEKIIDEVQKRRNLFGLGLTSLIAACGATDKATNDTTETEVDHGTIPQTALKAADATQLPAANTTTVYTAVPASNSDNRGHANRMGSGGEQAAVLDAQIGVAAEQRGVPAGGEILTFRIANGDHVDANLNASINKFGGNKFNLVVSSDRFGDNSADGGDLTGAIYIFWNIDFLSAGILGSDATTLAQTHLRVAGVKTTDVTDIIAPETPEFYQIGGDKDGETDQADMVFGSTKGYNILWDVTKYTTKEELTLGASPGILQVQGTGTAVPEFTKINDNDDYDMVVTDATTAYILWDVAKYHDTMATAVVNLAAPAATGTEASHGLLVIAGTGTEAPEFAKINNNDDYDMIVKGAGGTINNTYILWDVANYQKATDATTETAQAVVNFTTDTKALETAIHGSLTIKGAITGEILTATMDNDEVGFTDIDGGGVNDLAFVHLGNAYILFGEKVANRDGEKALSHRLDLTAVDATDIFYDKAGADRTAVAGKVGFFDYDLDGRGDVTYNVGYRFDGTDGSGDLTQITDKYNAVINPPADNPALSEEVYWDIA